MLLLRFPLFLFVHKFDFLVTHEVRGKNLLSAPLLSDGGKIRTYCAELKKKIFLKNQFQGFDDDCMTRPNGYPKNDWAHFMYLNKEDKNHVAHDTQQINYMDESSSLLRSVRIE